MEDQRKRFIGIDLAKKTMEVRILQEGKKVICWNAKTDLAGRVRLLKLLKEGDTVTIEACALAFKIAEEILGNTKAKVYVLDPRKLQIIWKSKKKTDGEDALKLAQMGMKNTVEELPIVPMPTEEEKSLRSAVHELFFLKRERVRNINRLHSVYVGAGITTFTKKDLKTKEVRERSAKQLTERKLREALRIHERINTVEEQIEEVEIELAELLVNNEGAKYIISIPGVSAGFAAVYMAFIGNGERFSNTKQVSNYSGLVPRVDQSGEKAHYGSIIKESRSELRHVAVLAAWALTRSTHGGSLKEKYEKKAKERGKMVAIVMLARRIIELCYVLVKEKSYYDHGELADENPKLKKLQKKAEKRKEDKEKNIA